MRLIDAEALKRKIADYSWHESVDITVERAIKDIDRAPTFSLETHVKLGLLDQSEIDYYHTCKLCGFSQALALSDKHILCPNCCFVERV